MPIVPPRRSLALEVCIVVVLAAAMLLPGLTKYSLVDPWETHYGEVARRMLQDHDWVHTQWEREGFRSKPVLTFWMMAASMKALGVADDGGYSGEMVESDLTLLAIRLPFALFGVLGLAVMWWMLARLISRRAAYLGLLTVGTAPFYLLVARQGITDIPMVVCLMAAIAMLAMSGEDDVPIEPVMRVPIPSRRPLGLRLSINAKHVAFAIIGGFVVVQALYYAYYFTSQPQLARGVRFPVPGIILPIVMVVMLALLHSGLTQALRGAPRRGPDGKRLASPAWRLLGLEPITRSRQVYMLWFWAFLGVSVLAKGPPALGIVGVVAFFYIALLGRWRQLYEGHFELKRGFILVAVIALPWHVAMALKEGPNFYREYVLTHVLNRASVGVDNEAGTFAYYLSQLGVGMWLWAALLPAALITFLRFARVDRLGTDAAARVSRTRLLIGIWAIVTVAFFSLVQTKFHHYILPAVPPLALIVALWLDDVLSGRIRPSVLLGLLGVGIMLMLARDMIFEEALWIEMFVFRYDRPWATAPPWMVNVTDGFLGLGLAGAIAIVLFLWLGRGRAVARGIGVGVIAVAAIAIGIWANHVYMPEAGTHWGMRDSVRKYYQQRTIYGQRLVYFGDRQLADDWAAVSVDKTGTAHWSFKSTLPEGLQIGQPMTIRIQVNRTSPAEQTKTDRDFTLAAKVSSASGHTIVVAIPASELAKLGPAIAAGKTAKPSRIRPVREVDADRLIAAQLYWRGEVFSSGGEIDGWLPEMKTDWGLGDSDNKKFTAYLSDPNVSPVGRRYFVLSESSRPAGLRNALPTARAKATWEQIDTTSNKFTLSAFWL